MINLILQFLLAHFIGDFVCQPNKWVAHKKSFGIRSKFLYAHIFIHLVLLLITTQFQKQYIFGILFIVVFHFIIDVSKIYLEKKYSSKNFFFIDQILHYLTIAVVVDWFFPFTITFQYFYQPLILLLATALILITSVSAIVMKIILKRWDFIEVSSENETNNAGKYIGILERLFIFLFIYLNFWQGIGFLLAAKSIFRFGDLKEAKDVKLTEYILIGTLLSFGSAIVIGLLFKKSLSII